LNLNFSQKEEDNVGKKEQENDEKAKSDSLDEALRL
jgi:hypothetical protein